MAGNFNWRIREKAFSQNLLVRFLHFSNTKAVDTPDDPYFYEGAVLLQGSDIPIPFRFLHRYQHDLDRCMSSEQDLLFHWGKKWIR